MPCNRAFWVLRGALLALGMGSCYQDWQKPQVMDTPATGQTSGTDAYVA